MFNIEKDWITEAGLRAVVIQGNETYFQHRCGYVGVPKEHPLHSVEYNQPAPAIKQSQVDHVKIGKKGVLIALTAVVGGDSEDTIRRSPDILCNVHGGLTYSGGKNYPIPSENLWWFGFDTNHYDDHDVSLAYCVEECESLARQLAEVK